MSLMEAQLQKVSLMIRFPLALISMLLLSSQLVLTANAQDELEPSAPLAGGQENLPEGFEGLENPFGFDGDMTPERLGELINRVDPEAQVLGNGYVLNVQERSLRVVYDERADRMRIITPIIPAADVPDGLLLRLLQANFDSVLDSRYAVGSGMIWSSFVHRLSSLTDEDFISGIAQTAVAAETFGTTFSSGAFVFGGGDSAEINEGLLERLREAIEDGEDDRGI